MSLNKTRIFLSVFFTLTLATLAFGGAPQTINYQGYLKNTTTGVPVSASMPMVFSLYEVETDGTPLWTETQTVEVKNGIYSVELGSNSPLDPAKSSVQLYLGIRVGNDVNELLPRYRLSCVFCALQCGCTPGDKIECYSGPAATLNVGVCRPGYRLCGPDGLLGKVCLGEVLPQAETANGLDNNCDGIINFQPCKAPADCGSDTACLNFTCVDGFCGANYAAPGTATANQTAGDCRVNVCEKGGNIAGIVDDTDVPDDGNPCTRDFCSKGVAYHLPRLGTSCNDGNGCTVADTCDDAGNCLGYPVACGNGGVCDPASGQCQDNPSCTSAANCGADTACLTRTCTSGVCGVLYTAAGTATTNQKAGDCRVNVCDGSGTIISNMDNTDVQDDGNACTRDLCSNGVLYHRPMQGVACDDGSACTTNETCSADGICAGFPVVCTNGGVCSPSSGQCQDNPACTSAADCGADTPCLTRTCTSGVCGVTYTAAGTVTANQIAGDCRVNVCDGSGAIISNTDNTDVQDDGNQCTRAVCSNGIAYQLPTPGVACDDGSACTFSDTCNADGVCGGSPTNCDDGNACTMDACDALNGCEHTPVVCTNGDVCNPASGQCVSAISASCGTMQVSTSAMIPSLLQTSTSYSSTKDANTGAITMNVTGGPTGVANDSIHTLANPYPGVALVGALATLAPNPGPTDFAGSVLLASGIPALPMTSTSLAGTAGLSYADFGRWMVTHGFPSTAQVFSYGACAGGTQLTPVGAMPTSGTKTYTGKLTGVLSHTPTGGSDNVSGDVSLTVDFSSPAHITSMAPFNNVLTASGATTLTPYTTYAPLQNPPFPVPFANIVLSGGNITGNSFSGTVTTTSTSGTGIRIISGNFYGAAADEVAGTFTINDPVSGPGSGLVLIGSFGAK